MDTTNLSAFIIPHVPTSATMSISDKANQTVDTINGKIRKMGHKELRSLEWSSFFPVKGNYNFRPETAHLNGYAYAVFLETMRKLEFPVRVIGLSNQGIPVFNFLASIDQFKWSMDKGDNINYSIQLTEFPERLWNFWNRDYSIKDKIEDEINRRDHMERLGLLIKNIGY